MHVLRTGAEILVGTLERCGIRTVCGMPGGANLPIYDALARSSLRHVLGRHEQGCAFIAQGMARVTHHAQVVLATSGPGAANLLTAVADAKLDSVPLLAITGQVPTALMGTDAFQELDTEALMRPLTKACFAVRSAGELIECLPEALRLAQSGRPGPVAVDIPKDVQMERVDVGAWSSAPLDDDPPAPSSSMDAALEQVAALYAAAERPLLYVGGGVIIAFASDALRRLSRHHDLPVVSSLCGLGAMSHADPRFMGMLGMHGEATTNALVERADLLLAVGVRFDDRATGDPERFARSARIVHIDIDPRELGKNKAVELGLVCDAKLALEALHLRLPKRQRPGWCAEIARGRDELQRARGLGSPPEQLMRALGAHFGPEAVVTTDVGQHQMWAAQAYPVCAPDTFLTSAGLGTMGFGLPAAIGAALARPECRVLCITGDGSLLLNVQELATLAELDLDVTIVVLDNGHLGLVRQQQTLFYDDRRCACRFERRSDYTAIARAFGVPAQSLGRTADPVDALLQALHGHGRRGPRLLHISIDDQALVLPMVPAGGVNVEAFQRPPR